MLAAGLGWNSWYYVLLGMAVVNTTSLTITFHPKFLKEKKPVDVDEYNANPKIESVTVPARPIEPQISTDIPPKKKRGPLMFVLTNPFCWFAASFMVLYLGLEISEGGWVVEFMIQVYRFRLRLLSGS